YSVTSYRILPFFSSTTPPPPQLSPLSLHDALPIYLSPTHWRWAIRSLIVLTITVILMFGLMSVADLFGTLSAPVWGWIIGVIFLDRKSTRLNSSHVKISYAVFCLKKKKKMINSKFI